MPCEAQHVELFSSRLVPYVLVPGSWDAVFVQSTLEPLTLASLWLSSSSACCFSSPAWPACALLCVAAVGLLTSEIFHSGVDM